MSISNYNHHRRSLLSTVFQIFTMLIISRSGDELAHIVQCNQQWHVEAVRSAVVDNKHHPAMTIYVYRQKHAQVWCRHCERAMVKQTCCVLGRRVHMKMKKELCSILLNSNKVRLFNCASVFLNMVHEWRWQNLIEEMVMLFFRSILIQFLSTFDHPRYNGINSARKQWRPLAMDRNWYFSIFHKFLMAFVLENLWFHEVTSTFMILFNSMNIHNLLPRIRMRNPAIVYS